MPPGFDDVDPGTGNDGHRERLRQRFLIAGGESLPDYELLELLLFRAIPRRDTKPLAKALMQKFGSFAGVIGASRERLLEVKGVGESVATEIKLIAAFSNRFVRGEVLNRDALGRWDRVIEYCRSKSAFMDKEEFGVLFLDKKNCLIADEVLQHGTNDHTPVYPREVIGRALELSAAGIILVHNHPSGDSTPSAADIEMTRLIIDAGKKLGVTVHDHIIVGRHGHTSFRASKLL